MGHTPHKCVRGVKEEETLSRMLLHHAVSARDDLRMTTVKLVVHTFVWREFPQDLGKCYQGLEKLEDKDVDDCFAVMSTI